MSQDVLVSNLLALGVQSVFGVLTVGNVEVGRCTGDGVAVLTPEGEALVDALRPAAPPAAAPVAPAAPARAARVKPAKPAEAPVAPEVPVAPVAPEATELQGGLFGADDE